MIANASMSTSGESHPSVEHGRDDVSIISISARNYQRTADNGQGPEALVRTETRIIDILRFVLMGIFVVVVTATSIASFKLSRKWEIDTFHNDFKGVGTRMTQVFLEQTSAKLWFGKGAMAEASMQRFSGPLLFTHRLPFLQYEKAYTMSVTISDLSRSSFPNTSVALYNIGQGVQTIAKATHAVWSPLLHNASERDAWEEYARQTTRQVERTIDDNVCYVCQSKDKEVGNPSQVVQLPTVAPYTCRDIQIGGLGGLIPPRTCTLVQSYVAELCGCIPKVVGEKTTVEDETIADQVFYLKNGTRTPVGHDGPTFPVWQSFPSNTDRLIMYDQLSDPIRGRALKSMMISGLPTFSGTDFPTDDYYDVLPPTDFTPTSTLFQPVFETTNSTSIVGTLAVDFSWAQYFKLALPLNSEDVVVVIENAHGHAFTYSVKDDTLVVVGKGDIHHPEFDNLYEETTYGDFKQLITSLWGESLNTYEEWLYKVRIYPSQAYKARYLTSKPAIYTLVVVLIFVFTTLVFVVYDFLVRRRQEKVMESAIRNDAFVSSLFPASIRDRLFGQSANPESTSHASTHGMSRKLIRQPAPRVQLQEILTQTTASLDVDFQDDKDPIADFFPRCSIIFADISGFTAWSSEREPAQVFRLLETVYRAFDQLAMKHGVFKIETIGDCYVAATGVPEAQADHASRICQFAHECNEKMRQLTRTLEVWLGPGTADLSLRIGIHSGPVTGGVLRGEKARFQLFGDTMNTAARMESLGKTDLIHVSPATAELIRQSGNSRWLQPREGGVFVKGKGDMQTYWVNVSQGTSFGDQDDGNQSIISNQDGSVWGNPSLYASLTSIQSSSAEKLDRLVDWNKDLLSRLLQRIVARRNSRVHSTPLRFSFKRSSSRRGMYIPSAASSFASSNASETTLTLSSIHETALCPIEDMSEILTMPSFCPKTELDQEDPDSVMLDELVLSQLREYVQCVAEMYRTNPFHNFEHASHVAMSAWKIMNRIIKPEDANYYMSSRSRRTLRQSVADLAEQIHQSTFGISSDALMQFAVVFCALIHDADHQGVTNTQLVQEQDAVALRFKNKCVAEQNSVHICWELLMEPRFSDLLRCICATHEERCRFRQLVVNSVIATDIADKELQMRRKKRWDKAFDQSESASEFSALSNISTTEEDMNRKATVVFEYIIQASDVAHTMQHWHIYKKWNERLFEERYDAYVAGREMTDPSEGWYQNELWFFDNYIIPLANKLEHCGVFGVSSDEYLNYAQENRREWEIKGQDIVQHMIKKYCHTSEPLSPFV